MPGTSNSIDSPKQQASDTHTTLTQAPAKAHAGLIWIGLMKLTKSLLFLAIAIGAIHMLHHDLSNAILNLAAKMRFDPESHFISLLLDQTAMINASRLREIGAFTLLYSALAMTEAVGLLLQKAWAEYFTLVLTFSFMPLECYEIYIHSTVWKWALVTINLIVVLYLLWVIHEEPEAMHSPVEPSHTADHISS